MAEYGKGRAERKPIGHIVERYVKCKEGCGASYAITWEVRGYDEQGVPDMKFDHRQLDHHKCVKWRGERK